MLRKSVFLFHLHLHFIGHILLLPNGFSVNEKNVMKPQTSIFEKGFRRAHIYSIDVDQEEKGSVYTNKCTVSASIRRRIKEKTLKRDRGSRKVVYTDHLPHLSLWQKQKSEVKTKYILHSSSSWQSKKQGADFTHDKLIIIIIIIMT